MMKSVWLKRKMSAAPVLILEDISVGLMAKNDAQAGLLTYLHFLSALPSHAPLQTGGSGISLRNRPDKMDFTSVDSSSLEIRRHTAAGLSGILTLFPFQPSIRPGGVLIRSPVVGCKVSKNFLFISLLF